MRERESVCMCVGSSEVLCRKMLNTCLPTTPVVVFSTITVNVLPLEIGKER
jgi:hypothetical protein